MQKHNYCFYWLWIIAFLMPAVGKAQGPQLHFLAMPSGSEVVPAVSTPGTGLLNLLFNADQSKVNISGMMLQLHGEITGATLQIGKKGENGPVLLDILPLVNGRRITGTVDVPEGLVRHLVFSELYLSIQTDIHPDGEIRGQFRPETDQNFRCEMSGNQMVPAVNTPGFSFGGIHFSLGSHEIDYVFLVQGLSGPVTATEIYEGMPGENGTLVKAAGGSSGNILFGLVDLEEDAPAFIESCKAGSIYIVLKTAAHPNGEIRGALQFLGDFNSFAPINGLQQVPQVSSSGFGFNYTTPNTTFDSLTTVAYFIGINPLEVNLHTGAPGSNGPVFTYLVPGTVPGFYQKTYPLTPEVKTNFINGHLYLNCTTTDYPNGEIRGVLRNSLRKGYAFDLCGSQVVAPTTSTGLGMGMASVDMLDCYIDYKIIVDGLLAGGPTATSIKVGNAGMNGPLIYEAPITTPFIADFHAIAAGQGALIESGMTYFEIATPAFPNGEIRGQIDRDQNCPLLVDNTDEWNTVQALHLSPNPVQESLHIVVETTRQFKGQLQIVDIFGKVHQSQRIAWEAGQNYLDLNTADLLPGVYQLAFTDREGHFWAKTVVKH